LSGTAKDVTRHYAEGRRRCSELQKLAPGRDDAREVLLRMKFFHGSFSILNDNEANNFTVAEPYT
jgi:hypothetical protein